MYENVVCKLLEGSGCDIDLNCITSAVASFSHCGVTKYNIPMSAPGKVAPRMSSVIRTTYGKSAVKYATLPEEDLKAKSVDKFRICQIYILFYYKT